MKLKIFITYFLVGLFRRSTVWSFDDREEGGVSVVQLLLYTWFYGDFWDLWSILRRRGSGIS